MSAKAVGLVMVMAVAGTLSAQEKNVESRVVSVGLFKNGLAVVTREVDVSGPGTYLVSDVPTPVHGTFWIESVEDVEVHSTMREVETDPRSNMATDFQQQLAGKEITVYFRESGVPPTSGKVISTIRPSGDAAWNRQYQQPQHYNYWQNPQPSGSGHFLILETAGGREYVDASMIARVSVSGQAEKIMERRPVLLLTTKSKTPTTIRMSYLAKGLSWAPSYRLDISNEKTLTLKQKAVIKNELEAFDDAEVFLISGFPSVQFGHVTSPLSLRQTWTTFFQQLNTQVGSEHSGLDNNLRQQVVMNNFAAPAGVNMSAAPSGEGPDIHYQPVGKKSMAEGDSIMFGVAEADADYARIVEWIVPDTRTANGRHIPTHERERNPDKYQDAAWDAIRFNNPLSFPMTTASAMIVGNGKFLGERTSYWVNQDEETTLHITKALSLRTRSTEHEEPDTRKVVYVGGDDYHMTTVKGELMVNNHRDEEISLVIRRRFSGDLLEASDEPECLLREEGAWAVNKRNELTWTLTLKPGEEKTFSYRYTVLVNR